MARFQDRNRLDAHHRAPRRRGRTYRGHPARPGRSGRRRAPGIRQNGSRPQAARARSRWDQPNTSSRYRWPVQVCPKACTCTTLPRFNPSPTEGARPDAAIEYRVGDSTATGPGVRIFRGQSAFRSGIRLQEASRAAHRRCTAHRGRSYMSGEATEPEPVTRLVVERVNAGDAAGVAALYEPRQCWPTRPMSRPPDGRQSRPSTSGWSTGDQVRCRDRCQPSGSRIWH